jgi:LysR family glycine cleavage system transcriptional activator
VRTFAVVAQRLSISRAAEELNVTPSAVSHQIKILENYLGTSLFRREKNKLALTAAGQQYLAHVSEGLLLLSRATGTIRAARGQPVLRIGAPASFAALWLVERLARFVKLHPEIAINLTASADPPLLLQGAFDVGFRYGTEALPGLASEPLGPNRVFPICKPSLVRGEHALRVPADLARCTLLDSTDDAYYQRKEWRQPGWMRWLQAAGLNGLVAQRSLSFTPRALMHAAVRAGLGVGLSRSLLSVDALTTRDLAVPFGPVLQDAITYSLVFPTHLAKRKDVAAFREWVLHEAAASTRKIEKVLKSHLARRGK